MIKSMTLGAVALVSFASGTASAATLVFDFTPATAGVSGFSFNIDSAPTPLDATSGGFPVEITNYAQNGIRDAFVTTAYFYAASEGGGFGVNGFFPFSEQLYTGATASPTLRTGSFSLFDTDARVTPIGTLNVTSAVAAVPEPATWGMMLVGFGAVGGALRVRRRRSAVPA